MSRVLFNLSFNGALVVWGVLEPQIYPLFNPNLVKMLSHLEDVVVQMGDGLNHHV